jgi:mRNA interferase MazF
MTVQPGDFWVAEILFTDRSAAKKRPVLVLWLDAADAVAAAVTSAVPRSPTDIALLDWQQSGLRLASTVRLSRLDCLEQSLFLHRLGSISSQDARRIKQTWSQSVLPQF